MNQAAQPDTELTEDGGEPGADPRRSHHWTMLVCGLLVVPVALLLTVQAGERVAPIGLPDYPLPPTCLSHTLFGVDCPGCGLTRSVVYLAHGDWAASWAMNRCGWLMALALIVQIPYRIWLLRRPGRQVLGILPRAFGYLLIGALIGNWLFNCASGHGR